MAIENRTENVQFQTLRASTKVEIGLVVTACLALCALPVLSVKLPPLWDYPSHLGRIYVIAHPDDTFLSTYYAVGWKITPTLTVDVILAAFARFLDIFSAGKLFLLLTIAVMVSGTFALKYALYREWVGSALSFLIVFNGILMWGFLPYLLGVGLALWATAGWVWLRPRPLYVRMAFSACAIAVLFLSHSLSVAMYLMAIACYEVGRLTQTRWSWRDIGLTGVAVTLPCLVAVPLLLALVPSDQPGGIGWAPLSSKWVGPYLTLRSANLVLDAIFGLALLVLIAALVRSKAVTMPTAGWAFLGLGLVAYLVTPAELFDGSVLDVRLPTAFMFFVIAFARFRVPNRVPGLALSGLIVALLAVRVLGVAAAWHVYDQMVAEYESSLALIPPGSRILVSADLNSTWRSGDRVTQDMDRQAIAHFPDLSLIERSSLVSDIHSAPKNPEYATVGVKDPYRNAIPIPAGGPDVPVDLLVTPEGGTTGARAGDAAPDGQQLRLDRELTNWQANYDYLYVQYAPPGTSLELADASLIYQGSSFQLYQVDKSQGRAANTAQ